MNLQKLFIKHKITDEQILKDVNKIEEIIRRFRAMEGLYLQEKRKQTWKEKWSLKP